MLAVPNADMPVIGAGGGPEHEHLDAAMTGQPVMALPMPTALDADMPVLGAGSGPEHEHFDAEMVGLPVVPLPKLTASANMPVMGAGSGPDAQDEAPSRKVLISLIESFCRQAHPEVKAKQEAWIHFSKGIPNPRRHKTWKLEAFFRQEFEIKHD